jgi:hypothetical protein
MWHLVGGRWRYSRRQRSRRDRRERGDGRGMRLLEDQQRPRDRLRGPVGMILVRDLRMLRRQQREWTRISFIGSRRFCEMCQSTCGAISRTRISWICVLGCRSHGDRFYGEQLW